MKLSCYGVAVMLSFCAADSPEKKLLFFFTFSFGRLRSFNWFALAAAACQLAGRPAD
jgi:hypothetical protein